MKLYLVYDKEMGSYYCPHRHISSSTNGWMGEAYKHHCLMEDRDEAQKILRFESMNRRHLHLQLLEIDMPEAEYQAIQNELADSMSKLKKAGMVAPSIGKAKKIKERMNLKTDKYKKV